MANLKCSNSIACLELPTVCKQIYEELTNIPFYRVSNGYAYASYLLYDEEAQTNTARFFNTMKNTDTVGDEGASFNLCELELDEDETLIAEMHTKIQTALEQLSNLLVTEEAFSTWVTFQKEQGDVQTYHQILETLYEDLIVLYAKCQITDNIRSDITPASDTAPAHLHFDSSYIELRDINKQWEKEREETNTEHILNHRNPFADISIREQKFIFGSAHQQFETLGLTTSHTLTKLIKDSDKSYLAVQPGFKIRKAKLTDMKKKQDIMFDDTLTTEIAQKDENIYVYIE